MAAHKYWRLNFSGTDTGSTLTVADIELHSTVGGANVADHAHGEVADSSSYNKVLTLNNGAARSNAAAKFGTYGLDLPGGGAYANLGLPTSSDWNFGTGDFTVEMWVYPKSATKQSVFGWATNEFNLYVNGTNSHIDLDLSYVVEIYSIGGITLNAWNHIAVSRTGSTLYLFVNGTGSSISNSTNFTFGSTPNFGANSHGDNFNGYIDEIRITKGVGRYTANFTAPSAPFPDDSSGDSSFSSVVLLTHLEDSTGVLAASSNQSTAINAFDNNTSTSWASGTGSIGWIQYYFTTAVDIVEHTVTAPSSTATNAPNRWTIQYSDDGLSWGTAAVINGQTSWSNSEKRTFTHSSYPLSICSQMPRTTGPGMYTQTLAAANTQPTFSMKSAQQSGPTISGTVKQSGIGCARTVRAYCRLTGEILGETTSDATTGAFSISAKGRTDHCYVVALDDLTQAPDYNAVVYDLVIPV